MVFVLSGQSNLWQDATGLLLWMSHPAWHSIWRVRALNHTTKTLTGASVLARLYDLRGKPLGEEQDLDLSPSSGTAASRPRPTTRSPSPPGRLVEAATSAAPTPGW